MIKDITFAEVKKVEVSGDPLTLGDIKHARKGARAYPGSWIVVMLTKTGARLEVSAYRTGFKWRLNGYASDGSDVGLAPPPKKVEPVTREALPPEPRYGGLWGLWTEENFGGWATTPFENPLMSFMLFDSKSDAQAFIDKNFSAYGKYVPKPKRG